MSGKSPLTEGCFAFVVVMTGSSPVSLTPGSPELGKFVSWRRVNRTWGGRALSRRAQSALWSFVEKQQPYMFDLVLSVAAVRLAVGISHLSKVNWWPVVACGPESGQLQVGRTVYKRRSTWRRQCQETLRFRLAHRGLQSNFLTVQIVLT